DPDQPRGDRESAGWRSHCIEDALRHALFLDGARTSRARPRPVAGRRVLVRERQPQPLRRPERIRRPDDPRQGTGRGGEGHASGAQSDQGAVQMKRLVLAFAFVTVATVPSLLAQSNSASLTVSASVVKNCTIATSPVNFGSYDPVAANASAPLDGTGTVTVTCTRGANANVALNAAANASGGARRLHAGTTDYMNYDLFQDAGRSQSWTDTGSGLMVLGAAPNNKPRSFTVYGRVPGAQDAAIGTYNDTVVA